MCRIFKSCERMVASSGDLVGYDKVSGCCAGVCRNHYSAERMVLVLLGGEPLETLEQWVKELFLAVPSGRGPRPAFGHLGRPYQVFYCSCSLWLWNTCPRHATKRH